jgi:hypothetical protein
MSFQSPPSLPILVLHARIRKDLPSESIADDAGELIQGVMLSRNVGVGNKSSLYSAGSLEAQTEYPMKEALNLPNDAPKDFNTT